MAKVSFKFTKTQVAKWLESAVPQAKAYCSETRRFYLKATRPSATGVGRGSFYYYYRSPVTKQAMNLKIGTFPEITIEQARNQVRVWEGMRAEGKDPKLEIETELSKQTQLSQQTVVRYLEDTHCNYLQQNSSGKASEQNIKKHFADWLNTPMANITHKMANEKAYSMYARLSSHTIRRVFSDMRTMLTQAVINGAIEKNPFDNFQLRPPRETTERKVRRESRRRYLEKHEGEALLRALRAYDQKLFAENNTDLRSLYPYYSPEPSDEPFFNWVRPYWLIMFYTGFRNGDVRTLRWEEVQLESRQIIKVISKTAKSYPDPRSFPIVEPLAKALHQWWRQCGRPTSGWVFPSSKSDTGHYAHKATREPWAEIKKLAGLPEELELYSLRANFASHMVMAGCDLLTVSKLMAHTKIQTTIDHYGRLQPNKAAEYVNTFANFFESDSPEKEAS